MKLQISRVGDSIAVYKEWKDIQGRGEIAHILVELEIVKNELMALWVNYDEIEKK
jgi:hypothetical protein